MRTSKIKTIKIYSESSFIPKILSQVCKDFLLEIFPYSGFAAKAINTRPSIAVVDVRNQMVFDKVIKPYLQFYSLYPLILLIPNDLIIPEGYHNSQIEVLAKPVNCKELSTAIEGRTVDYVYQISQDLFLNHKTMSLVKIHSVGGRHLQLTSLEFKILKYILEVKATTEKEILTNVFGYHDASSTNTFKVHIHRLKQKLGFDLIERKDNGEYIIRAPELNSER